MSCRPEEYFSDANKVACDCKSILQANVQARAVEKAQHEAMLRGMMMPSWDSKVHEIRHRYRKEIVDAGNSTKRKSPDNIY